MTDGRFVAAPDNVLLLGEYAVTEPDAPGIALGVLPEVLATCDADRPPRIVGRMGAQSFTWSPAGSDSTLLSALLRECRAPSGTIEVDSSAFSGPHGKLALGSSAAAADHDRAVTHKKGVLNGIAALTQATGNDTRAIEAASPRLGRLRRRLCPAHQLPVRRQRPALPAGVSAATRYGGRRRGLHPVSRLALRALVTEGIQHGHMRLHAERLAFEAGARDAEVPAIATTLSEAGQMDVACARRLLRRGKRANPQ